MWFTNCSIFIWPQYVNKPLLQLVKVFPSTPPHLSSAVLHPSAIYPGSTSALCLLIFAFQDVLIISSKNTISVYSTEQKNLIADSSIRLCFTGVENNKQGGGLHFQTLTMRLLFKRDLMRLQEAIDDNYIRTWLFLSKRLHSSALCIGPKLKCGNAWDGMSCWCPQEGRCSKSSQGHEAVCDGWSTALSKMTQFDHIAF